jgi:hypothetical protein
VRIVFDADFLFDLSVVFVRVVGFRCTRFAMVRSELKCDANTPLKPMKMPCNHRTFLCSDGGYVAHKRAAG